MTKPRSARSDPATRRYEYFDRVIESDLPLPELREAAATDRPALAIRGRGAGRQPEAIVWFRRWLARDGAPVLVAGLSPTGYVLRFADLGDLELTLDCSRILYDAVPPAALPRLRQRLLDQALPRAFAQQGALVLHASAVGAQTGAVCIAGDSGYGKSTLAAYLAGDGFTHLGDDALLIRDGSGTARCIASYAGMRLWPDASAALPTPAGFGPSAECAGLKRRLLPLSPGVCGRSPGEPIAAVLLLGPAASGVGAPVWTRAGGADAATALFSQCFKLDITDRGHLADLFGRSCRLAASVPVYRLDYPRDLAALPSVGRAVRDVLTDALAVEPRSAVPRVAAPRRR